MNDTKPSIRYRAPASDGRVFLVAALGMPEEVRHPFSETLEIGRDTGGQDPRPGLLLISDATVSRSHCVLTYRPNGRCVVRDTSRNGTRIDGRRLVPNVEHELQSGQRLSVGDNHEFVVIFEPPAASKGIQIEEESTAASPSCAMVTVLVGDISDYTALVRRAPSPEVQQSVSRVFQSLTRAVVAFGGTVKEFQGDAIVAFWEGTFLGQQAFAACRAALHLSGLVRQLAADRSIWRVGDFPLNMDWALASGPVVIDSFGDSQPAGLSIVGEAPVLAFRLEKFAEQQAGRILACRTTRDMACRLFRFRDLGTMTAKGFDRADHVFALEAEVGVDANAASAGAQYEGTNTTIRDRRL